MWLDLAVIFLLQVLYVTIMTARWIILMRGRTYLSAAISFVEVVVYIVALGLVVRELHDPLKVLIYALGYAVGVVVGQKVEARLAIGYSVFQVVTQVGSDLAERLRQQGLGVTAWQAAGREGPRQMLLVVGRRRWSGRLLEMVDELDPKAFVIRIEPEEFRGGFLLRMLHPARR